MPSCFCHVRADENVATATRRVPPRKSPYLYRDAASEYVCHFFRNSAASGPVILRAEVFLAKIDLNRPIWASRRGLIISGLARHISSGSITTLVSGNDVIRKSSDRRTNALTRKASSADLLLTGTGRTNALLPQANAVSP